MDKKDFKFSKFNAYISNEKNEVLLYNSLVGSNSFCKVDASDESRFLDLIKLDVVRSEDLETYDIEVLKRCGIIVPFDADEMQTLKYFYMREIERADKRVLHLTILPTGKCNFACEYCYEKFSNGRMSDDIKDGIFNFVKKNINFFSALEISWFGGEPLIELDIILSLSKKFIDLCKATKKYYYATVTTNGYLLDVDTMNKLLEARVLGYQITIDGCKEFHDKYRHLQNGGNTFDTIIANLKNIKRWLKTGVFRIYLRSNFTKESSQKFEEYIDYFNEQFGDDSRFSMLVRSVGHISNNLPMNLDIEVMDTSVSDFFNRLYKRNPRTRIDHHQMFIERGGCVCYAARDNDYVIDSVGNIRKCTVALESDYNIVGKVNKDNYFIDFSKMKDWVTELYLDDKCRECSFIGACMNSSCPSAKADKTKIYGGNCPNEKVNLSAILMMLDTVCEFKSVKVK